MLQTKREKVKPQNHLELLSYSNFTGRVAKKAKVIDGVNGQCLIK